MLGRVYRLEARDGIGFSFCDGSVEFRAAVKPGRGRAFVQRLCCGGIDTPSRRGSSRLFCARDYTYFRGRVGLGYLTPSHAPRGFRVAGVAEHFAEMAKFRAPRPGRQAESHARRPSVAAVRRLGPEPRHESDGSVPPALRGELAVLVRLRLGHVV